MEILALEHQIKEKQRQIELLMRMFVPDEQAFLKDPSGQSEGEEARAKRKFEIRYARVPCHASAI